jgi:hypothetical protein
MAGSGRFRSGEDAREVARPASDVGNLSVAPTTTEPATMPINERRSSRVAFSAIPGTARAKNNSAALPIRDAGHGESW